MIDNNSSHGHSLKRKPPEGQTHTVQSLRRRRAEILLPSANSDVQDNGVLLRIQIVRDTNVLSLRKHLFSAMQETFLYIEHQSHRKAK